jgi:recombination protein RecA
MGADANVIQKSGAWFSMDGERIGQGRDNARTYLEQHPALMEKVVTKVMEHNGLKRGGPAGDVAGGTVGHGSANPKPSAGGGEGMKPGKGDAGAGPAQSDSKSQAAAAPNGAKRPNGPRAS